MALMRLTGRPVIKPTADPHLGPFRFFRPGDQMVDEDGNPLVVATTIVIYNAEPADGSLSPEETVLWFDEATGEIRAKTKRTDLTVVPTILSATGAFLTPRTDAFVGEVAPQNADTLFSFTLTFSPLTPEHVDLYINGVSARKTAYSVGGTGNRKITWLGSVAPGTGTADISIDVIDEIGVDYWSI